MRVRRKKADAFFPSITSIILYDYRVTEKGSSIFLSQISWIKVLLTMVKRGMVKSSIDEIIK